MDSNDIFKQCMKVVAERHSFVGEWPQQQYWKSLRGDEAKAVYQEVAEEYAKKKVAENDKLHHDLQKRMTAIQNSSRDD